MGSNAEGDCEDAGGALDHLAGGVGLALLAGSARARFVAVQRVGGGAGLFVGALLLGVARAGDTGFGSLFG